MATNTITATAPRPFAPPEDKFVRRPTKQLPQSLIDASRVPDKEAFDANKHVNFQPPSRIYTMEDLGLEGQGISTTAISEPFQLFTEEAIRQMRGEIFSQEVLDKHQYASSFASNMVRGACPEDAPFIMDAWNDPKVLDAISEIAGIDLVPVWAHDIANINISIKTDKVQDDVNNDTEMIRLPQSTAVGPSWFQKDEVAEDTEKQNDDTTTAFGWHVDSVPFVCVTMLSDCTGMVGGETMIRTGRGEYMKMRGPTMGTAVIMQGRYISHQALAAHGGRERISMVTSLRPKSVLVKDESVLTGVRGISNVPELYYQYASYRYENLEERLRHELKQIRRRHDSKREFDLAAARQFLLEQRAYIDDMLEELIEP